MSDFLGFAEESAGMSDDITAATAKYLTLEDDLAVGVASNAEVAAAALDGPAVVPPGIPEGSQQVFIVGIIHRSHADPLVHLVDPRELHDSTIRQQLLELGAKRAAARADGDLLDFVDLGVRIDELRKQLWETSLPLELKGQHREIVVIPAASAYWALRYAREGLAAAKADVNRQMRRVRSQMWFRAVCGRLVTRLRLQGRLQEAEAAAAAESLPVWVGKRGEVASNA